MARYINLYDPSLRPKKEFLSANNLLLAALICVLLVSMGALGARWRLAVVEQQASSVQMQLKSQRDAFDQLTRLLGGKKEDKGLEAQVVEQEKYLKSTRSALVVLQKMVVSGESPVVGEMMWAFSRASIEGLWLTGFVFENEGQNLEIRGRMVEQALLPAYLKRLEAEPVFQGRRFAALDMRSGEIQQDATAQLGNLSLPTSLRGNNGRWYIDFSLKAQREALVEASGVTAR